MEASSVPPLISVALCTYNGELYLREQLDSLFAQTYKNIEVVVVDDCSTDSTVSILSQYALKYKNMRVMVNQVNQGFSKNFEIAILKCQGQFIAPCDQDDVWLQEKIDLLHRAIEGCTMSYCDSFLINSEGDGLNKKMSDIFNMKNLYDPMEFVMSNCVSGHAMLFRSEIIKNALPIPKGFYHDWWIAAVAAADRGGVYVPRVLVKYRQHEAAITDSLGLRRKNVVNKKRNKPKKRVEIGERIVALAGLRGSRKKLLMVLNALWGQRSNNCFCWRLVLFALVHRNSLWGLVKRSAWWRAKRPFRYLIGLRWRGNN